MKDDVIISRNENWTDFKKVINNNYCIGCGACSVKYNDVFEIKLDKFGMYKPDVINEERDISEFNDICPFSGVSEDETEIAKSLYPTENMNFDHNIGYFHRIYTGYTLDNRIRSKASSGGIVTWILLRLLEDNLIDGIIHVKPTGTNNLMFEYAISTNEEEVLEGAKSHYYPIEYSKVISKVRKMDGRYAFVGVPCFIKSLRLLMRNDEKLKNKIVYLIGLVCGHLKSTKFAESVLMERDKINYKKMRLTFRTKIKNRKASDYGLNIIYPNGKNETFVSKDFFGYNWGYNFFKYNACDYCDDIFSETADITVGDAWLKQYKDDYKGTSIIITRDSYLNDLLKNGVSNKQIHIKPISKRLANESQSGGIRHRREGLKYRLHIMENRNKWYPKKRVSPEHSHISRKYKDIFRIRHSMMVRSHLAFRNAELIGDFNVFKKEMRPLMIAYPKPFYRDLLDIKFFRKLLFYVEKIIKRMKLYIK